MADFLTPALDAATAKAAEQSQAFQDYLVEFFRGGDASGMMKDSVALDGDRKRSPSAAFGPQFLDIEPPEDAESIKWDAYTLPEC